MGVGMGVGVGGVGLLSDNMVGFYIRYVLMEFGGWNKGEGFYRGGVGVSVRGFMGVWLWGLR